MAAFIHSDSKTCYGDAMALRYIKITIEDVTAGQKCQRITRHLSNFKSQVHWFVYIYGTCLTVNLPHFLLRIHNVNVPKAPSQSFSNFSTAASTAGIEMNCSATSGGKVIH